LSPFIFYFSQSQTSVLRKLQPTAENYFWGLTFSLPSFSHHSELVLQCSCFSNLW